jgi:hypothetical protein
MKRLLNASRFAGILASALLLAGPVLAYDGEVYAVCKLDPKGDNYLSLRSCPSSKCPEKLRLRPGQFVLTIDPSPERGWRAVFVMKNINDDRAYEGPQGFVANKYICYVDMTE